MSYRELASRFSHVRRNYKGRDSHAIQVELDLLQQILDNLKQELQEDRAQCEDYVKQRYLQAKTEVSEGIVAKCAEEMDKFRKTPNASSYDDVISHMDDITAHYAKHKKEIIDRMRISREHKLMNLLFDNDIPFHEQYLRTRQSSINKMTKYVHERKALGEIVLLRI